MTISFRAVVAHIPRGSERRGWVAPYPDRHGFRIEIASSELTMVPNNLMMLNEKAAIQALKLMDRLEELDDVQRVFTNADFPDEALEKYRSQE